MHENVALVISVDGEVDFVWCFFDGVLWKPLINFFIAANPHEQLELPEETTAIVT